MMWLCLIASGAAVPLMYGVGPQWGLWLALAGFAAAFATFCLLYDEPVNRARRRVQAQLSQISSVGLNSEDYHRLQSTAVKPTDEDRKMVLGPMLLLHLGSGLTGAGLTAWAIALRTM